jgi:hypothetical protein
VFAWRARARRSRTRRLHRWHRLAGISAAAFLIFLTATGLPLQFTDRLDLGSRHVGAGWILDWYGLEAPGDVLVSAGVAALGDRLFMESGEPIAPLSGFAGAVRLDGLLIVAGVSDVLLLDAADGTLIDRFRLERNIRRIGIAGDVPVLDTTAGRLAADAGLVNWVAAPGRLEADWAAPEPAPGALADDVRRQVRSGLLSLERLLQDLHSGRAFGTVGILVVDVASALLLFLSISGLIMWWRSPRL